MVKVDNNHTYYFFNKTWSASLFELDQYLKTNQIDIKEIFIESNTVESQLKSIIQNVDFIKPEVSIIRNISLLQQHQLVVVKPDYKANTIRKLEKAKRQLYVAADLDFLIGSILRQLEQSLVRTFGLSGINSKALVNIVEDYLLYGNDSKVQIFVKWLQSQGMQLIDKFIDDIPYIVFNNSNIDKLFYHYINTRIEDSSSPTAIMNAFHKCVIDLTKNIIVQRTATLAV